MKYEIGERLMRLLFDRHNLFLWLYKSHLQVWTDPKQNVECKLCMEYSQLKMTTCVDGSQILSQISD